jgi:Domain of unknown function (DUF3644)
MRGLPRQAKGALEKARDSAILAVEVYNKPAVKFKSGGYISMMVIAWTSLFHAVFFKRKLKPFYRKESGRFVKVEGDYKYWELDECLNQYFKTDTGNPVRKNLEFFIPLRNKIEHRSMPELDASIFGECQAMLLNFDEMLEKEFGAKYCLRECLSFALQLFPSSENLADAVKHKPETKPVVDFIQQFRSTISPDITASGRYSFKAFLIQVANHRSENALPIQFVHYDRLSEEERKKVAHLVAMVKFKEIPVSNLNIIKAGEVAKLVQQALGDPKIQRGNKQVDRFNVSIHSVCWRKYKVRPPGGSSNPEQTDYRYCIYDKMHNDYGYTQAWVDFLAEKLRDQTEFDSLYKHIPSANGVSHA